MGTTGRCSGTAGVRIMDGNLVSGPVQAATRSSVPGVALGAAIKGADLEVEGV